VKLAVVSTTVHGERGYLAFDKLARKSKFSDVVFVVSGDKKSLSFDRGRFECEVEYIDANAQQRYHCSEPMGWNKIMRRNIALLRAIELKPDFILTVDDDNIPKEDYFDVWYETVTNPVDKLVVAKNAGNNPCWHNYLKTCDADIEIYPRGFPIEFRGMDSTEVAPTPAKIPNENIGVYQGISLGDPDVDAITRIVYPHAISKIRERGYCCRDIWSPYNTQNTMFSRVLFPLAFVWPHCGRYDDIYSSFVWQQFLFSNDMYTYVGDPVNTQDRGHRGILRDLNNEIEGYMNGRSVWESITAIQEKDPLEFIKRLTESDNKIVNRQKEFMLAYLRDLSAIV
jgi:hypothetical protein